MKWCTCTYGDERDEIAVGKLGLGCAMMFGKARREWFCGGWASELLLCRLLTHPIVYAAKLLEVQIAGTLFILV